MCSGVSNSPVNSAKRPAVQEDLNEKTIDEQPSSKKAKFALRDVSIHKEDKKLVVESTKNPSTMILGRVKTGEEVGQVTKWGKSKLLFKFLVSRVAFSEKILAKHTKNHLVCEHLATAYLLNILESGKLDSIDTPEKLAKHPITKQATVEAIRKTYDSLFEDAQPKERPQFSNKGGESAKAKKRSKYTKGSRISISSSDKFSKFISSTVDEILQAKEVETKQYLWTTTNHVMALRFEKKDNDVVIHFYDPGDTANEKSMTVSNKEQALKLKPKDLVEKTGIRLGFGLYLKSYMIDAREIKQVYDRHVVFDKNLADAVKLAEAKKLALN